MRHIGAQYRHRTQLGNSVDDPGWQSDKATATSQYAPGFQFR